MSTVKFLSITGGVGLTALIAGIALTDLPLGLNEYDTVFAYTAVAGWWIFGISFAIVGFILRVRFIGSLSRIADRVIKFLAPVT